MKVVPGIFSKRKGMSSYVEDIPFYIVFYWLPRTDHSKYPVK